MPLKLHLISVIDGHEEACEVACIERETLNLETLGLTLAEVPLCQDRCVCRSNAVSVSAELTGRHEKLPKRWRNRPAGACLQGPAPNHPRAALAEDRGRERRGRRRIHVMRQV